MKAEPTHGRNGWPTVLSISAAAKRITLETLASSGDHAGRGGAVDLVRTVSGDML